MENMTINIDFQIFMFFKSIEILSIIDKSIGKD